MLYEVITDEAVNHYLFAENRNNRIIGVVKDHHHLSLKEAIQPVIFFNSIQWNRTVGYYRITSYNVCYTKLLRIQPLFH